MVQFGVQLRQEREHRGVSLETMCASTKLSLRQLLDVESGNFKELPGGIFRKGFVRSYLRALALDEPVWLERFESSYRASGLASSSEAEWGDFAENVRNNRVNADRSGTRNRWLGVLAMTIVLLAITLCVWRFVIAPKLPQHGQSAGFVLSRTDVSQSPISAGECARNRFVALLTRIAAVWAKY